MSRRTFGAGPEGVIVDPYTGAVRPGSQGSMWNAEVGGQRITDLLTLDGQPLPSGVITADRNGRIRLQGPDSVHQLWADFGHGRFRIDADDLAEECDRVTAEVAAVEAKLHTVEQGVTDLEASRGAPGGIATLGPDGRVPYPQLPPLPVGASRLAELTDVAASAPTRGQTLVHDGTVWRPGRPGPYATVAAAQFPLYIASQGGANIYPANSLEAAVSNAAAGITIDVTAGVTADDIAVALASPVDTDTVLTGNVSDLYYSGLARPVLDAESTFGPGWGNLRVPTLSEVLTVTGGRILMTIECQTARAVVRAVDAVRRHNHQDAVIIQSFTQADLAPAAAAGMNCMLLHANGAGLVPATLKAAGINWLGTSTSADPAVVQTMLTGGMKVVIYTVNRHVDRDLWLGRGVHGFFSADPYYLNTDATRYRRKADPFKGQTYPHGFLPSRTGQRGAFVDAEWWRPTATTNNSNFVLQGWGCPMDVNANSWTMTFTIRWENVAGADVNNYPIVVFGCPTDVAFTDTTAATDNGYMVKFGFTGSITLSKRVNGVVTTGPTVNTPAPTVGQLITYTVAVSASSVVVTRPTAATPNSITWSDASLRGRYFHLGQRATTTPNRIAFGRISYV